MKQTAVEWLIQRILGHTTLPIETINELILKSISMEKEQIEESYNTTYGFIDGQEYYEKTYGIHD
jgi:hypothetical protein